MEEQGRKYWHNKGEIIGKTKLLPVVGAWLKNLGCVIWAEMVIIACVSRLTGRGRLKLPYFVYRMIHG